MSSVIQTAVRSLSDSEAKHRAEPDHDPARRSTVRVGAVAAALRAVRPAKAADAAKR